MKRSLVFLIITLVIVVIGFLLYLFWARSVKNNPSQEELVQKAKDLYSQAKDSGKDLSRGPCLGKVSDDWVVDIAHVPRQDIDNFPENQCDDFNTGKANHFIELDPDGNVIRTF